jgi:hypothetical protein
MTESGHAGSAAQRREGLGEKGLPQGRLRSKICSVAAQQDSKKGYIHSATGSVPISAAAAAVCPERELELPYDGCAGNVDGTSPRRIRPRFLHSVPKPLS